MRSVPNKKLYERRTHRLFLVLAEQNEEGHGEAPQRQQQESKEPALYKYNILQLSEPHKRTSTSSKQMFRNMQWDARMRSSLVASLSSSPHKKAK